MISWKRMITQQRKCYIDSQPSQLICCFSLPFANDGCYLFLLCVGRSSSTSEEKRIMCDSFPRNVEPCVRVVLPKLVPRQLRLWKVTVFQNKKRSVKGNKRKKITKIIVWVAFRRSYHDPWEKKFSWNVAGSQMSNSEKLAKSRWLVRF